MGLPLTHLVPLRLLVFAFYAGVFGWSIRYVHRRYRIIQIKLKFQCRQPTEYPQNDVLGIQLLSLREQAKRTGRLVELYDKHFDELGSTFQDTCHNETTINTRDPVNIRHIQTSPAFGKPFSTFNTVSPFMGESVLNDGPYHKLVRTMLKPAFSRAEASTYQIKPFMEKFFQKLP